MVFQRLGPLLVSISLIFASTGSFAQHMHAEGDAKSHIRDAAPLLDNIGSLNHPVSTKDPLAQRLFNQGLMMDYAFNHMESERSFRYAAQIDPKLAMAWWGVALANASNLNSPIDEAREKTAYEAIQKAIDLKQYASAEEKALIDAAAKRFTSDSKPDFAKLELAYADAMQKVAHDYQDDPDAGVLYADAIMNTMPWDYYEPNGDPKPGTKAAITELERLMERWPQHPGANHFYIHVVEASSTPERATGAAERLGTYAPAAGHLVHMPSHIWVRTGRWNDAVIANQEATKADEDYISQCHRQGRYPLGYYPHNLHMLTFAAMMEGRSRIAIEASKKAEAQMPKDWHENPPSYATMFVSLPYFPLVRFGKWDDILALPEPPDKKGFVKGMWHYARGMAYVRQGKLEQAEEEADAMNDLLESAELDSYRARKNVSSQVLSIARFTVMGEVASTRKEYSRAVALLRRAVDQQDHLVYDEPEDWYYPARQTLGNILLKANRPADAEAVFLEDLVCHPKNGWSLFGLTQSLRAQGNDAEAARAQKSLEKAWERADVKLTAAVF